MINIITLKCKDNSKYSFPYTSIDCIHTDKNGRISVLLKEGSSAISIVNNVLEVTYDDVCKSNS